VPRRVDDEVRLHRDGLGHPEDRLQASLGQMHARDGGAFQRHAQPLRRGIQRHLRAVKADGEVIRRALLRIASKPVGPLDDADVALDQRHVQQLVDALDPVFPNERRAGQRQYPLFE
jgi:hypothetical protein